MLATIRTLGMFALLASLFAPIRADLWVDCENGDDANSGASPAEPFRTINAAMNRLDEQPAVVRIAAGSCPSEGGVRLQPNVHVICAGVDRTRIVDKLYLGSFGNGPYLVPGRNVVVEDCSFESGTGQEARSSADWRYHVTLRRCEVGPGELDLSEAGERGLPVVIVEDTKLASLRSSVISSGFHVSLLRTDVTGLLALTSGSDSSISMSDGRLGSARLLGNLDARFARVRFEGASGIAVRGGPSAYGLVPWVEVSSSLFRGYDCGFCEGDFGAIEVENSTFVGIKGQVIGALDGWKQGGTLKFDGNAFLEIGGVVLSPRPLPGNLVIRRNNFSSIGGAVWCTTPGTCLDTVDDLNAQPWADGNLALAPEFVDEEAGDYRLRADSPLIDAAQRAAEPLLQPLDLDGVLRPVDGDRDGEARSDIGAYEYSDEDGDGVADRGDRCLGTEPGADVDDGGCSIAQLCPCEADWRNHGAYVTCVETASGEFGARKEIVQRAARSGCGRH